MKTASPDSQLLALAWLKARTDAQGGLAVSNVNPRPYPEVTGYAIPTLLHCGEHRLAHKMAKWLVRIQNEDGSFPGIDGEPQIFDTGQVLRGMLSVRVAVPEVSDCIARAVDWMLSQVDRSKMKWERPRGPSWRGIPEGILLYALAPLQEGLTIGKHPSDSSTTLGRLTAYYARRTRVRTNSHFLGYIGAGLLEIGQAKAARRAVRRRHTATWPGMAQLAETRFRLGNYRVGEQLLASMAASQLPSGGWTGGSREYFDHEEISWGPKFYLDACSAMQKAWFDRDLQSVPESIPESDERLAVVLSALGDIRGLRVLDAGCGKGRFLRHLERRFPSAQLSACDFSSEALEFVPDGVEARVGELTNLPYPSSTFDAVFCVEALEHAVFIDQAIAEMKRVVRKGGKLVVLDKSEAKRGSLPMAPWEQWFPEDLSPTSLPLTTEDGLFRLWVFDV